MTKDEVTKLRMNSPESLQFLNNATKFYNLMMMYRCAIREIQTKLEVLDDEFSVRSEEHTSELQSLRRISYAVFCLKKKDLPFPNKMDKDVDKRQAQRYIIIKL